MHEGPDNLVLVYLRRLDERTARMHDDVVDLKLRMTTVETQVGTLVASEQSHYASLARRIDMLDARVERIEGRLDLMPAA
jgi:hypothetical protein